MKRQSKLNLLGPIKEPTDRGDTGRVPDDLSINLVKDMIDQSFIKEVGSSRTKKESEFKKMKTQK